MKNILTRPVLGLVTTMLLLTQGLQAQQNITLTLTITDSVETPRSHYLVIGRTEEIFLLPDSTHDVAELAITTPKTDEAALKKVKAKLIETCIRQGWTLVFPYEQIPYDYLGFPASNNQYRSSEFRIVLKDTVQIKAFLAFANLQGNVLQGNIEPVYPEAVFPALSLAEITRMAQQEARRILKDRGATVTAITAIKPSGVGGWTAYPPLSGLSDRATEHPVNPNERNGFLRQYRTMEVTVVLTLP